MTDAVNIKIDGKEFTDFTQATVTKSIETLSGKFTFICTSTPTIDFPIKVNSKCEIIIQGERVINGFIEKIMISYNAQMGSGSHEIRISGRDRTADLLDSTVGGSESSEFQPAKTKGITLKKITEKVLSQFKLSDIKVIDTLNLKPFTQDIASVEYGTSGFDFIEKYAKKRQVLLTTNGDGDIVFTRTPTKKYKTSLILSKDAPSTILNASIHYDNSKRYNTYLGSSQDNPSGFQQYTTKPIKNSSVGSGQVIDKEIRESRIYHFEPDFSAAQETLKERVKWEANFRRVHSEKLIYTVQGHIAKDDKEIWKPGHLIRVVDEFANILNGVRLISSINYVFSLSGGSKTELHLLPEDAFSLIVNKPEKSKEASGGDITQYISKPVSEVRADIQAILRRDIT